MKYLQGGAFFCNRVHTSEKQTQPMHRPPSPQLSICMSYNVYKLYGNYIFRTKDCIVEFIAEQYILFSRPQTAAVPTDAESHPAASVRAGDQCS